MDYALWVCGPILTKYSLTKYDESQRYVHQCTVTRWNRFHKMRQETIAERAKAIRLGPSDLSRATGLTAHTVGRTLNGRTKAFLTTAETIERVIVAEELRLRDYLLALHPVATTEMEKAS